MTKQREKLEGLLEGMNPFNAKSRASEIGKVLDIYIPAVEKMQTQLDKYQVTFTKTATENKKLRKKNSQLKESLENAQEKSVLKKLQDNQLRKDYDDSKDNAAFDRCIDVMTRLILKYGKQVLESQESDKNNKIIEWDERKEEKIAA